MVESCECPVSGLQHRRDDTEQESVPTAGPAVCLWAAESHGNGHVTYHICTFSIQGNTTYI